MQTLLHERMEAATLLERVVSWATDGAATERSSADLTVAAARHPSKTFVIRGTPKNCDLRSREATEIPDDLLLTVPCFTEGRYSVYIQDGPHAIKTLRNQPDSGANVLVFGNSSTGFNELAEAHQDGAPTFSRDIYGRDRQSDGTARRFFSPEYLAFLIKRGNTSLALVIYCFIYGLLMAASTDRKINHLERLELLLTSLLFTEQWESFIKAHPSYTIVSHGVSANCFDIIRRHIRGLISLMFIYREQWPKDPLYLWLHMSTVVEHIFSVARKIVPDFTTLDFVYMMPKINTIMRDHRVPTTEETGDVANGYIFDYFERDGASDKTASLFFTDAQATVCLVEAHKTVKELLTVVGIDTTLLPRKNAPSYDIDCNQRARNKAIVQSDSSDEYDSSSSSEYDSEADEEGEDQTIPAEVDVAVQLRQLGFAAEDSTLSPEQREELQTCAFGALAIDVDSRLNLENLKEDRQGFFPHFATSSLQQQPIAYEKLPDLPKRHLVKDKKLDLTALLTYRSQFPAPRRTKFRQRIPVTSLVSQPNHGMEDEDGNISLVPEKVKMKASLVKQMIKASGKTDEFAGKDGAGAARNQRWVPKVFSVYEQQGRDAKAVAKAKVIDL